MKWYILQYTDTGRYIMNPTKENGWQISTPNVSDARIMTKKEVRDVTNKFAHTLLRLRIYPEPAKVPQTE